MKLYHNKKIQIYGQDMLVWCIGNSFLCVESYIQKYKNAGLSKKWLKQQLTIIFQGKKVLICHWPSSLDVVIPN